MGDDRTQARRDGEKRRRQAEALRENLKRRKAQARGRREAPEREAPRSSPVEDEP